MNKRERESAKVNEDAPKKKGKSGGAAWWSNKDSAPPMLGMKDIPQGRPFCLYEKVFVITGVLESLDRDTASSLIQEYGGLVAKSVANKVTHALVGNEPGPSKVKKIEERNIPMLTEDELFEMIRTLPEQKPPKDFLKNLEKSAKAKVEEAKVEGLEQPTEDVKEQSSIAIAATFQPDLWTTKYAPKDSKLLLSNPGPIKKVQEWLARWPKAHNDKGFKKALLISGGPGIGKTTTANLLAREEGYNVIEFNASDTRSKKKMQEEGFAEIGGNRSINEFFGAKSQANTAAAAAAALKKKTLVIMDEVDGMGASDRGGNQELIALIKKTKIPIICICNDRQKATVKTLANYCEDIRFQRPQVDHIVGRVRAIMENEGFKHIDMNALRSLCASVNNDIRQVLNLLQMLRLTTDRLEASPEAFQSDMAEGRHVELSSFAIIPQLFSGGARTPSQALDLFFHDYDLIPLFVQENYLSAIPNVPKHVMIENMAKAADCISYGDIVKDTLMQGQEWGLLPFLGMVSTVIPCALLRGRAGKVDFPEWLGKNSTASKEKRLLKEIQIHMNAKTAGAGKADILLDYIPSLAVPLLRPLQEKGKEGIDEVLQVMKEYGLTKDDWETIFVLNGMEESIQKLDSQLKSAFTKKYNKTQKKFTVAPVGKKGTKREVDEDIGLMNEEAVDVMEGSASEEVENFEKDALIKKKAKKAAPAASKAKPKATKKK
jgi:replication factor C subunit 1